MTRDTAVHRGPHARAGRATGGVLFAAVAMILAGTFQLAQGLVAIADDNFYVVVRDYTYEVDLTGWGWAHLIMGALVVLAGAYLYRGSAVAGVVAIVLAGVSAITNFVFLPYYPYWALMVIVIDIFIIWSIVRSGLFRRERARR